MEALTTVTGRAAPFPRANIDTDAIFPSKSALHVGKRGYGKFLFASWRTLPDGRPDPEFVLNQPAYAGASILIGGTNFGCGSSREAAVWALVDTGIRCVLAPSFGSIFAANCGRNGVLAAVAEAAHLKALTMELQMGVTAGKAPEVTVDLLTQTINGPDGRSVPFDVDPRTRELLLNGLDEIGLTLQRGAQIAAFRSTDAQQRPWAYNFPTRPKVAVPTPAGELPTVGPAGGEVDVDVDPGA